ncbi:MAG: cobalamin-binding protein [Coriobacteriia bacterium]|nr:cobalamin-binding protein [Coriobacteriia bacterium]
MRCSKKRVTLAFIAFLLVLAVAVVGCTGTESNSDAADETKSPQATYPVTVTDDAGRDVTIAEEPERIVSLAPANTEIVAALGLLDRLVGVTTFCDYPPEVVDLPKVGDFVAPNIEAIAASEPDLILATTGVQAETIAQLEQLGAAVIAIDPQTIDALYTSIETVGVAAGKPAEAQTLVDAMKADLEEVASAVSGQEQVTCFLEIAQDPLFTAGPGTLLSDVITAAGGQNVVGEEGYVGYSLEQLLIDDPDVYLATKGSMSDPSVIESRAGYDALAAVKGGRVYVLDDNLVSRPGPRVVEGVRRVAEALYPDAF